MRKIIVMLAGFVVLSLLLALAPMARANHLYATDKVPPGFVGGAEHRINLLANCAAGATTYPVNTGFFVSHGWSEGPWKDIPAQNKSWFMSPAQTFELRIDGMLQESTMYAFLVNFPDGRGMFKSFVSEDPSGLSGTHAFVGTWYYSAGYDGGNRLDRVFAGDCTVSVAFV